MDSMRASSKSGRMGLAVVLPTVGILVAGCAGKTVRTPIGGPFPEEDMKTLEAVAGAVSGRPVGPEEMERLRRRLRSDPETRAAVELLTGTPPQRPAPVKYCPVTGKRYSPRLTECPIHHVPLKTVEP